MEDVGVQDFRYLVVDEYGVYGVVDSGPFVRQDAGYDGGVGLDGTNPLIVSVLSDRFHLLTVFLVAEGDGD